MSNNLTKQLGAIQNTEVHVINDAIHKLQIRFLL